MAGKNDILATAGVDLSAFEAGIAKLTSRLDGVEKAGNKAASGIERVDKSAQSLKNIQIADHFVNALGQIAGRGGQAAQALGAMDLSVAKNDFSGMGAAAAGAGASLGRTIDFVGAMPGGLGVAGKALGQVAQILSETTIRNNVFADSMAKSSASTEGFIRQSSDLAEIQRAELAEGGLLADQGKLEAAASGRDRAAKGYAEQTEKQIALEQDLTAGGQQRLATEIEIKQAAQKIADLKASQTVQGVLSPAGQKIVDAGTKEINAQLELRKKALAVSETTEKSETDLSNIIAKRDVTLGSQLTIIEATGAAVERQLAEIEKQGLGQTKQAADLRAKLNEQVLAKQNFYYLNGKDLEQQKLITAQINAQAAGNQKLAALAQVRAQFELQIADAIRQGNDNKARELARQQAAAELGVRAADIRKNPQQRAQEVKEQQAQGLAERTANARDKDIKARADAIRKSKRKDDPSLFNEKEGRFKTDDELLGRTDSTNRKSKADEKARQEFADRNEKRLLDAGKDAINKVFNFQAENFIAGKIINAP